MPTYVCSARAGSLDDEQKTLIAEAIARNHSAATGAPTFFVQVVHEEKGARDRFLGGEAAEKHIWIRGDVRAGRTVEQRTGLMLGIMKDVSKITGIAESEIWIYLCNLEPTDMVEYGHVLPAPGDEQAWFATLPKSLQDYLVGLGTQKKDFTL